MLKMCPWFLFFDLHEKGVCTVMSILAFAFGQEAAFGKSGPLTLALIIRETEARTSTWKAKAEVLLSC